MTFGKLCAKTKMWQNARIPSEKAESIKPASSCTIHVKSPKLCVCNYSHRLPAEQAHPYYDRVSDKVIKFVSFKHTDLSCVVVCCRLAHTVSLLRAYQPVSDFYEVDTLHFRGDNKSAVL